MTRFRPSHEAGVALIAVILVLAALLAIATPFSLSMRNQEKTAQVASYQTKAQKSIGAALAMGEESLASTDPSRDATRYYDTDKELVIDLDALASHFNTDVNDPYGSIWSVHAEDEQGKIDVNQVSPFFLGNLIGSAILSADLDATELTKIDVDSTDGFPEEGLLWLEGELVGYRSKEPRAFTELERGFSTTVLKSLAARTHEIGTVLLDYRVLLATVRPYKLRDGAFIGYPTARGLKDIAAFGEMSILADELDDWEADLTAHAVTEAPRFWGGARSVIASDAIEGEEPYLNVIGGGNLGTGSVVRIRSTEGERQEYNLVVRTEVVGIDRQILWLQEPLQYSYDAGGAIVDGLARAPVNVNTCSRRVLASLLKGLRFTDERPIPAALATSLANLIYASRPIIGEQGLAELLKKLEVAGELGERNRFRELILLNAMSASDTRLVVGTAPFTYRNHGSFTVEASVSENLEAGREASRLFAREVSYARPAGEQLSLWNSQTDFYDAMRLARSGRHWTTFPNNLSGGQGESEPGVALRAATDWETFSDPGSDETEPSSAYARLAPVRKDGYRTETAVGMDRLLHFDDPKGEGGWLHSADIDGWNVADQGPLHLDVGSELVNLLSPRDWVWPFCIEGWFTFHAGSEEAILFDVGENPIRNRIFAFLDSNRQTLVFRVADGTIPDFASGYESGSDSDLPLTQMAEIRYSFDDGLAFEEEVPYHFSFYARGTKPSDMLLMVDGVARGRRAFQTRLSHDLSGPAESGPFSNIKGYSAGQNQTLQVVDPDLFPDFGVVLVDQELVEYTSKTDKALIVTPTPGDPFGRRSARGTRGTVHRETESVQLYGYTAILTSPEIPPGKQTLGGTLGTYGVAMVDPEAEEAKKNIMALPIAAPAGATGLNIGRGIDGTIASLPLKGLAKPSASGGGSGTKIDFFNRDGGFALIISSPVMPPSNGAGVQVPIITVNGAQNVEVSWARPWITGQGEYVGMSELVYYNSFDGNRLNGLIRSGPGFLDSVGPWEPKSNLEASGTGLEPVDELASRGHVHVSQWLIKGSNSNANQHDLMQPIFVVPISVGVKSANLVGSYPIPQEVGGGNGSQSGFLQPGTRPELVQLGSGWTPPGSNALGGTEWIRYDSIAKGQFVRDHPTRLRLAAFTLGRVLTEKYTMKNANVPASDAVGTAINFELNSTTSDSVAQVASAAQLSADLISGSYPEATVGGGILAFRGVLGTGAKGHPAGETFLPVFRTLRGDVFTARPGPRDFVTLIDPDLDAVEEHQINFAYSESDAEGWGGAASHVAFDSAVNTTFKANIQDLFASVDDDDLAAAAFTALQNANVESRDFARMLKFPSGELPTHTGAELVIGGDFQGAKSPRTFTVDEVEFFNPTTPSEALPRHPRYVLSREINNTEKVYLDTGSLRFNMWDRSNVAIQSIDPVSNLPKDGFVLLIDDELIAISDVNYNPDEDQEAELTVAVNGRGYLGTPIQLHTARAAVADILFLRVSRLERSIDSAARQIVIADDSDFPDSGVAQVGRELFAFTRKDQSVLSMPNFRDNDGVTRGFLRGRYGTTAGSHEAGSLIYQFPVRYEDRYRPLCDAPELGFVGLHMKTENAFFRELTWQSSGESERCELVVDGRVGGRGSFLQPATASKDRFQFTKRAMRDRPMTLMRHGDELELRVFVHYLEGAFDGESFDPDIGSGRGGSNDWKRAPRLELIGVDWIGGPTRVNYEEWR